ncbi:hypothetical protein ACA910_020497 [Epithemia clementina (nom. ined.)]
MNEFVGQTIELANVETGVWIGMKEHDGFLRWIDPRCSAGEEFSDHYFFRSDQPNNVLPKESGCVELLLGTTGVSVPGQAPFLSVQWNDVGCNALRQCVCQKPHPTYITPRGPCVTNPAHCFPDFKDKDNNSTCSNLLQDPFKDSSCWGAYFQPPHDFQIQSEYFLGDHGQDSNAAAISVFATLDEHEEMALSYHGHVSSVHSQAENDLFNAEGAYQNKIFFRLNDDDDEPLLLTQAECQHACYQNHAQQPCVNSMEEHDFLVQLFAGSNSSDLPEQEMWVGYTDQNMEGEFAWTNAACQSTFTNWASSTDWNNHSQSHRDCAVLETNGALPNASFWNATDCHMPKQCVCQIDRPCGQTNFPTLLLGAERNRTQTPFSWLDESTFGIFTNWAFSEPINGGGAGVVEDLIELRSPSGGWYLPRQSNNDEAVCAPYKRPKQHLDVAIEIVSTSTTTSNNTGQQIRLVPGVPLLKGSLQRIYSRRISRHAGNYVVLGGQALLLWGTQANVQYSLQPLKPILDSGFAVGLKFDYFPMVIDPENSDEGILVECFAKLCFLGVCQSLKSNEPSTVQIVVEPENDAAVNTPYPLLLVEQYCSTLEWRDIGSVGGFFGLSFQLQNESCPLKSSLVFPSISGDENSNSIVPTCQCNAGLVSATDPSSSQVELGGECVESQ